MKVALYMRVSTDEQTTDNQEIHLKEISEARRYEIFDIYKDIISGSRKSRPELDRMLSDARRNKFDMVLAVKVDRISRSLIDLIQIAGEIGTYNIRLSFTDQDIDISSTTGKLMFQILGSFAEFEKEMIRDRTKAGLRRAKREGKKLGRPKIHGGKVQQIRRLKEEGKSIREISDITGISKSSVSRTLNESVPKSPPSKMRVSDTVKEGVPKSSVIGTDAEEGLNHV